MLAVTPEHPFSSGDAAMPSTSLVAGLGGAARNACVTLCSGDQLLGICEQERITRVRAAGVNPTGLPDEALDILLRRAGHRREDVSAYALAEPGFVPAGISPVIIDHHFGHACSAFLPSPFQSATIVVCDHEAPYVSVWDGDGNSISPIEWPWHGIGLAELYSQCADAVGFTTVGKEQRMEALARLDPGRREDRVTSLFRLESDRIEAAHDWQGRVAGWLGSGECQQRAAVAAALQSRIGDFLVQILAGVKRRTPARAALCVGGSLFNNSYLNSRLKLSGVFDSVFIPINPDNAGLSVGAALFASQKVRQPVTPFLGPSYTAEEIKATLENCKLTYQWASEADTIAFAVKALRQGRLVAWFDGPMEWGPRALGARSILASPLNPYTLENLNRFLKQREAWRGYGLSGLESAVREHFEGPEHSPFMESDYAPKDRELFRHVLPGPNANVRVHSVGREAPPKFQALLNAFGQATGLPMVVNTSFNGFREPIVCSPRDAVRVFFGTGIDVLVLGQFLISK